MSRGEQNPRNRARACTHSTTRGLYRELYREGSIMAKLGPGSRDAGGGSSGGRGHVGQQEAHGKDGADNEGKKEVGQY